MAQLLPIFVSWGVLLGLLVVGPHAFPAAYPRVRLLWVSGEQAGAVRRGAAGRGEAGRGGSKARYYLGDLLGRLGLAYSCAAWGCHWRAHALMAS